MAFLQSLFSLGSRGVARKKIKALTHSQDLSQGQSTDHVHAGHVPKYRSYTGAAYSGKTQGLRKETEVFSGGKDAHVEEFPPTLSRTDFSKSSPHPLTLDLMREKTRKRINKTISMSMLLLVIVMLCYGLVLLYSSSITNGLVFQNSTSHYIFRQSVFTFMGLLLMGIIARSDIRFFAKRKFIFIGLLLSFILLLAVLIPGIGRVHGGARRWLPLGFMEFQPSEITKVVLIFYLSWYYSRLRKKKIRALAKKQEEEKQAKANQEPWKSGFRDQQTYSLSEEEENAFLRRDFSWKDAWEQARIEVINPMAVVITSVALIMLQAHVSASIIITLVSLCIMACANLHWRSWFLGIGFGAIALSMLLSIVIVVTALFPNTGFTQRWLHVGRRITSFVSSDKEVNDDNRQTEQALIAIGSGGVNGVGLGQSRQKYLYLPENHNDYIFSIASEELGFKGGVSIIALFSLFLYMGMRIASKTSSMFSQLVAAGCTFLIVIQGFFSIGVNVNLLPATGISLPLFSYGGTSNIFFMLAVGIILSISKHGLLEEEDFSDRVYYTSTK